MRFSLRSLLLCILGLAGLSLAACEGESEPPAEPFEAPPLVWTFIPVSGAKCRDGSDTGVAVSLNPASDRVMIYLEGGGACFNALTCALNPASFDAEGFGGLHRGLFDRENEENPVADWSFVYVPYCTGDVHIGDRPDAQLQGVKDPQQLVGYANMRRYLARAAATFPAVQQVLLTGSSAGGFGAAGNFGQAQKAFGDIPVTLLDDSGPPMDAPFLTECLLRKWVDVYGLSKTLLADCGKACADHGRFLYDYVQALFERHPGQAHGLFSYTADNVIRLFFGFGMHDCNYDLPGIFTEAMFAEGLEDLRDFVRAEGMPLGTFYIEGSDHTILGSNEVYEATADGVRFIEWVRALLEDGEVAHVGP